MFKKLALAIISASILYLNVNVIDASPSKTWDDGSLFVSSNADLFCCGRMKKAKSRDMVFHWWILQADFSQVEDTILGQDEHTNANLLGFCQNQNHSCSAWFENELAALPPFSRSPFLQESLRFRKMTFNLDNAIWTLISTFCIALILFPKLWTQLENMICNARRHLPKSSSVFLDNMQRQRRNVTDLFKWQDYQEIIHWSFERVISTGKLESKNAENDSPDRIPDAFKPKNIKQLLESGHVDALSDEEIGGLIRDGILPLRSLESALKDYSRAVGLRRKAIEINVSSSTGASSSFDLKDLPFKEYDWSRVYGACCENVIGYMPIPVGIVGPLLVDDASYHIPMSTTEGVLVASTTRGCKAINLSGGVQTVLTGDGMTRAPVVAFPDLSRAAAAKTWLDTDKGQRMMKRAFDSTSRFARLQRVTTNLVGSQLFLRFRATTGDAMGMNMISKGAEAALAMVVREGFSDMQIISLSGNYCADKKATAVNWIEGRGKGVVAQARISAKVVSSVLKVDIDALINLNQSKNLVGSAVAGALGGFNAHAANIVAAIFMATGQDAAQVVESASCLTTMIRVQDELHISVSMPSLEVATVGGGTVLRPQSAMLDMLNVKGPHITKPGDNAGRLARIIAATVLAGELSLCSALATGHLVKAHMQYNRKDSS